MKKNQSLKERIVGGVKSAFDATIGRLWRAICDLCYSISSKAYQKKEAKRVIKPQSKRQKKATEIGFLAIILALPIANFLIFYVYVNISSIFLAFQKYNTATFDYEWIGGIDNFKQVITDLTSNKTVIGKMGRSFLVFAVQILIGFPLNLMFAYVIYKKVPASGFFQVVLFLPSIISTMVITLMFRYFVFYVIPPIFNIFGYEGTINLITDLKYEFGTQVFYFMWAGFGVQLVMYSGAMSRIPDSIVEAASLDGITPLKEFWFISIPMVWQTITIFLVTTIAGIFTNQMAIFNFHGAGARDTTQTIGYFIFTQVIPSNSGVTNYGLYPYAAAFGLLFTLVVAPITLICKYLLEKYGPNVEI